MHLTPERISLLLQKLYAASADPSLFDEFLELVQEQTQSSRAYLLMAGAQEGNCVAAQANWDPYYTQLYAEHYADNDPLVTATIKQQKLHGGDWAGDRTSVLSDEVYFAHPSFHDMLVPVHDLHLCGSMMSMPNGYYGSLVLRRERSQQAFAPEVISLLNILIPHLKQSLKLHGLLQAEKGRGDSMASSLEAFNIAVLAVDSRCRVHHASSATRILLDADTGLSLRNGELNATNPRENDRLRNLISGAVATAMGNVENSAERKFRTVPTQSTRAGCFSPSAGGAMQISRKPPLPPLNVSVLPFTSSTMLVTERPAALVFLQDSTQRPPGRSDVLKALFKLSPAECRVGDLLLTGADAREIAEHMHITLETARFQIKRVLAKTETRKQSELIRLILALPGAI